MQYLKILIINWKDTQKNIGSDQLNFHQKTIFGSEQKMLFVSILVDEKIILFELKKLLF